MRRLLAHSGGARKPSDAAGTRRMSGGDRDERKGRPDGRAERLAAELRANLARRKAQARTRRDDARREAAGADERPGMPKDEDGS
jgi:hypothetical protein